MQIKLEQSKPGTGATLRQLATATRRGNDLAFRQLVKILARVLVSLAGRFEPEDPADLISVLYLAVQGGASSLIEIQSAVRTIYRNTWRAKKREARKRSVLRMFAPENRSALPPGAASLLLRKLPREDAALLLGKAEGFSLREIAKELGISTEAAKKRWQELSARLREYLES